jgi:hypothetical protein
MATIEEITAMLQELSPEELEEVQSFVESLRRKQAPIADTTIPRTSEGAAWSFDFLEGFRSATRVASRDPAGMEIKVADATCGGITRPALWEHPPVSGSASVGYLVPVPAGLQKIKLKFAIGIRDGSELPTDRVVAFRVLVNGWKLWSTVKNARAWEEHEIEMPQVSSDVARIEFGTDGLGDSRWNWAVWGNPQLVGESAPPP